MSTFSEKHVWKVLEAYKRQNSLVINQIESFDDFINFGMQEIVDQESTITLPNYTAKFGQITVSPPRVIEEDRSLTYSWPIDARRRDLNYDASILCDITETYYEGDKKEKIHHPRVVIGRIPIMLKSSVCNLNRLNDDELVQYGECPNDVGGYFIIKGNERVLVGQMRAVYNQVFVLRQKPNDKYKWIAETRSMSDETGHSVLLQAMIGNDDRTIDFSLPYIKEPIPVGVVFKALGYDEEDIVNLIGLDCQKAMKYIRYIIRDSFFCQTQKDSLKHISQFSMHIITEDKQEDYAWQVVETETLPHLGISGTIDEQACFLGRMVRRLIMTHIGERAEDDRDNYANKRVETAGALLYDIFRNLFKKYTLFIKASLEKRKQRPDILSIISRIKSITKGINQCFSTGNWGVQKNASYVRTGVSQILDRMTYRATLSHLRRVIIPMGKEGKNTAIRQIHQSSFGFVCPCECFHPETKILLWNGEVKFAKQIKVDDTLIDDKGLPVTVKSTCAGFKEMYTINHTEKHFENYTVTDNHILTLKSILHNKIKFSKRTKLFYLYTLDKSTVSYNISSFTSKADAIKSKQIEDGIIDITVEKYLKLSKSIQNSFRTFKCQNINWPENKIDMDPYITGLFFGSRLKGLYNEQLTKYDIDPKILDDNIPINYIVNSRENRLKLLAGIADILASKNKIFVKETNYKNFFILKDIKLLAQSVGLSCYIKNNTFDRELVIYGNMSILPTKFKKFNKTQTRYNSKFYLTREKLQPFVGWQLEGNGRFLLDDLTVTHNTPEGAKVGVVLNYSLLARITKKIPKVNVRNVLEKCKTIILVEKMDMENIKNYSAVFLNGSVVGFSKDAEETIQELKNKRNQGLLDREVSISYDVVDDDIRIFCDEGRFTRPLLTTTNNSLNIQGEEKYKWNSLIRKGLVQYVDAAEIENCVIAMTQDDFAIQNNDFCEIHPCTILGIMAAMIPFPDHSQSPRNCYQSSMGKQALGIPAINYNLRTDTILHVLQYPQRPLVSTKAAEIFKINDMPSGVNAIVAIACYSGYNQEDSLMVNYSSVQRGLFSLTSYHTIDCAEKKRDTYSFEEICLPPQNSDANIKQGQSGYFRRKNANYSLLDENGIVRPRERFEKGQWVGSATVVKKGDVLIGKVVVTGNKSAEESRLDDSVIVQPGEEGTIDRVHVMITPNGYKLVKIVIRVTRQPTLGDKLASTTGQKGTIGMVYRQEDMPFTASGVCPDIIINPLCLSGDSIITLADNSVRRIDQIVENEKEYCVKTINPSDFTETNTAIHSSFAISPTRKMVKVKTWSGREIVCTDDHPFLTDTNTWKKASELKPNSDMLTIVHSIKPLSTVGEVPNIKWSSNVYKKQLSNFVLTEQNLEILARLLGSVESDGHLCIRNNNESEEDMTFRLIFYLGEKKDTDNISTDIEKLGFLKPFVHKVTSKKDQKQYMNVYRVDAAPALGYVLYKLGAHTGRKSTVAKKFPDWLINASLECKRQFLSGLQGGDGSYIAVNTKTVQQQIRIKPTKMTARKCVLHEHMSYMTGIKSLFEELGIECGLQVTQPKDDNSKEIGLSISVKMHNVEKYSDLIYYAYSEHKQRRSRIGIEFLRLRNRGIRLPYEKMIELQRGEGVAMYVDSVEEVGTEKLVYDFATRSENHSFIANSIVVHNCMPSQSGSRN